MIGRVIGCLLLIVCLADALADFGSQKVYDEFDFKGKSSVVIDEICSVSCRIYASVTPDSKKLANNLLIQLPKGFYSVANIAEFKHYLPGEGTLTNQKGYLEVNSTTSLTIINANANYAAGPLVLYVVDNGNNDASNVQPEVYEAENLHRDSSTVNVSMTVMSARPFTLTQAPLPGYDPQGLLAIMGGYYRMDESGQCPYLYYTMSRDAYAGFTMEVNGPIVSIMWDTMLHKAPQGEITATLGISNNQTDMYQGWFSSPGFHGCPGVEPYRSSLYDYTTPFSTEIKANPKFTRHTIAVDVVAGSDAPNPVTLTNPDSGARYSIDQTPAYTHSTSTFLYADRVKIEWAPDGTDRAFFLARWRTKNN